MLEHQKNLNMKNLKWVIIALLFTTLSIKSIHAQCGSKKSNHKVHRTSYNSNAQTIVDIALASDVHTTLVAALKAADLVSALQADGPFTVFAPTDNAFAKIDSKTLGSLLKPENKETLQKILTYHVVPAKVDAQALVTAIKAGGGAYSIITLSGNKLTAKIMNGEPVLEDEKGNFSVIRNTDLTAHNGIIHVIDTVVMPK